MKNITSKDLGNGFIQLKAKRGYKLYSLRLGRVVSEAIIKPEQASEFNAVEAYI